MIAIVTDSTAPITQKEAEQYGICVVPHSYMTNGIAYLENYTDKNENYTRRLLAAGTSASTGQSTAAAFATAFRQLLTQGYEVLCIVISSRLSGAWSSAVTAAREIGSAKIAVVDSHATAGALYFQIRMARELADSGCPLNELADHCKSFDNIAKVAFSVENMGALRRSRRLGFINQSVNTILNRRPVFCLEGGSIVSKNLARGRGERVRMLSALVPKNAKRLMVQGFGNAPIESSLMRMLQRQFPEVEILHRELGPVLSIHIGAQALAVSWCLD
ncbi:MULTISPECIES: DegV family protein [Caproicibacterium]|uniref:DegV family protein n=1 Tax=Caproicibacterium argilliputei TaxID=3030016 RepID=A0AA97DB25_9FIRM|nr:DegV family protein [Caproicibacterium argilliputei]WOC33574.1 DegV family protein [Caproicibacterium argilliputei]